MTCDESLRSIADATEGLVPPDALEALVAHLEQCPRCRFEVESQMDVKRVLGSRPEEPLPPGLARRIAERLDREGPLAGRSIVDWRKLTVRLLPAAAALAVVAGLAHRSELNDPTLDLPTAVAVFGQQEIPGAHAGPLIGDISDEQALGLLLLLTDSADRGKESRR